MKTFTLNTEWATYENCFFLTNRYCADDSLYIEIYNYEDGPIAILTVCLNNPYLDENETYVDRNNCPWAEKLVTDLNVGEVTNNRRCSGFCVYPSVKFNMEELKKYMPEDYE